MKAQHIKIKCNRSSFSSEAVANFSSGSCLKQQWQHRGLPTLPLWRVLGSASLGPVRWLLVSYWGDLPVATALQLPWGMYPGGTAAPTEGLCLGRVLLLNKKLWTMFGAGMKGTYFCFNLTASFFCSEKHPCNLQAGEKHLSSCFQPPCRRWTEQVCTAQCPRWSHPSPQHWGTAATEMLTVML